MHKATSMHSATPHYREVAGTHARAAHLQTPESVHAHWHQLVYNIKSCALHRVDATRCKYSPDYMHAKQQWVPVPSVPPVFE